MGIAAKGSGGITPKVSAVSDRDMRDLLAELTTKRC